MKLPADLVFDPTLAVWEVAQRIVRPHALLSKCFRIPDGLTSKPHHAPRRFGRITWTAWPATGIGLQPQTRRIQPRSLYLRIEKNARHFCKKLMIFSCTAHSAGTQRTSTTSGRLKMRGSRVRTAKPRLTISVVPS